jgi:hypothetical protein
MVLDEPSPFELPALSSSTASAQALIARCNASRFGL